MPASMPPPLSAIANTCLNGLLVKSAVVREKFRQVTLGLTIPHGDDSPPPQVAVAAATVSARVQRTDRPALRSVRRV